MLALAWILSVLGAITAYIVSLAGAMRAVPRLYWQEALVAVPLPVLAAVFAGWRLLRRGYPGAGTQKHSAISAGFALGLALLTLLLVATSYFDQPGGPH